MHVTAIGTQIQDGVADDLARPVVGDVAAAPCFVNLDTARGEEVAAGEDVGASAIAFDAERQDVRMLDEEQDVFDAPGPPLLDEVPLERQGVCIGNEPQATDV
jgi:hypothetical protein